MNKDLYIKRLIAQGMSKNEATKFVNLIIAEAQTTDEAYYIKVDYKTGDSFHTYDTSEDINLPWHNIIIVKENVKRLEEHLELYNIIDEYYHDENSRMEAIEKWNASDWHVPVTNKNKIYSSKYLINGQEYPINIYSINLLKDDGTEFQISTSGWIGFFENYQSFSIEVVDNHKI